MAGHFRPTHLKTKCSFWLRTGFVASRTIGADTVARAKRGAATTWTRTPTISPALVEALDLKDAIHVGHSTGGGQITRYIGRYGADRVAKIVLIGAVPPLLLQTPANPKGIPIEVFDQIRAGVHADRAEYFRQFSIPFYGWNRAGAKVSEGLRDSFVAQAMQASLPAVYECIKAFSETDFTEDLKRFDVPTLIMHGDDDQIVPIGISGLVTSKLVKGAKLRVYPGLPHGMCSTNKDQINADLLAFVSAQRSASA